MMGSLILVHELRATVGVKRPVKLDIGGAQFDAGKLHLLVGGNGAGKSTFVRTLLSFHPIQQGKITWFCLTARVCTSSPTSAGARPWTFSSMWDMYRKAVRDRSGLTSP